LTFELPGESCCAPAVAAESDPSAPAVEDPVDELSAPAEAAFVWLTWPLSPPTSVRTDVLPFDAPFCDACDAAPECAASEFPGPSPDWFPFACAASEFPGPSPDWFPFACAASEFPGPDGSDPAASEESVEPVVLPGSVVGPFAAGEPLGSADDPSGWFPWFPVAASVLDAVLVAFGDASPPGGSPARAGVASARSASESTSPRAKAATRHRAR
jgi:hypothetical protein